MYTFNVFADLMELCDKVVAECSPVSTKSLLLWGELDELVPPASVEFVESNFSNLTKVILPDVGHGMLYTNRDNVIIDHIVDFLSGGKVVANVPFEEKA